MYYTVLHYVLVLYCIPEHVNVYYTVYTTPYECTFQGSTLTECTLECTNEKTTLECTNKKNYTQVYTHMSVLREKLHSIECTDGLEETKTFCLQ